MLRVGKRTMEGTRGRAGFALCESFQVLNNNDNNNNYYNHIVISSLAYLMSAILIRCLIKFTRSQHNVLLFSVLDCFNIHNLIY